VWIATVGPTLGALLATLIYILFMKTNVHSLGF
jgi:glycerol uptake facilitator-like aquaporin